MSRQKKKKKRTTKMRINSKKNSDSPLSLEGVERDDDDVGHDDDNAD